MIFEKSQNMPELQNTHVVLTAWFQLGKGLCEVLPQIQGFPPFIDPDGRLCALGLIKPGPYAELLRTGDWNNGILVWQALREMADNVNEKYEAGTLLPIRPVTLFPAFTVCSNYKEDMALRAIEDVFKAHDDYIKGKNMTVLLYFEQSWSHMRGVGPEEMEKLFRAYAERHSGNEKCIFHPIRCC